MHTMSNDTGIIASSHGESSRRQTFLLTAGGRLVTVRDIVGVGRDSVVYRGVVGDESLVAVKLFDHSLAQREDGLIRIAQEIEISRSLRSARLVSTLDAGVTAGRPFIVTEYMAGGSLDRVMEEDRLSPMRLRSIALDLCLSLSDLHLHGFVHGDLKPQNVLFDEEGRAKIADFGLTRRLDQVRTTTEMRLGTIRFIAPEVMRGGFLSPATDIYALGVILYRLMTGRYPFDGASPLAVALAHADSTPTAPSCGGATLPRRFDRVILRCLEKDPRRRYASAREVYRAVSTLPWNRVLDRPSHRRYEPCTTVDALEPALATSEQEKA